MSTPQKVESPLGHLKKSIALWGVIAFLTLTVIPIVFGVPEPYLKVLMTLGTALFVALTVSYFTNKKIAAATNFEVKTLIENKFPKLLKIEEIGLEKIVYENKLESIGIDLAEASDLYIVMNDGKNFFTNNSKKLKERFRKPHRTTTVILMSPECEAEKLLNQRNGKTDEKYYAGKIKDATKDYIEFHADAPESNILNIRYYPFNITMSIVATENLALMSLYRNSAGKALVPPSFLFRNDEQDCEYANMLKDVNNLVSHSEMAFSSQQNAKKGTPAPVG